MEWILNNFLLQIFEVLYSREQKKHFLSKKNTQEFSPFLKWAWWKRQILKELEKHLPKEFNNYFEPFLWWGSFYFHLNNKWLINWKAYLNDYNFELINAYKVIKDNPKRLIKYLEEYKQNNSPDFFYEIRDWDRRPNFKNKSKIKRAARFIYLNKTCFNGIWRVNSKWQNNVPYWKNNNPSIYSQENISSCNNILNKNTFLQSWDFKEILKKAKKWDFIFLDPPYDPISETANFTSYNGFTFCKEMQKEVHKTFKMLDKKWCFVMVTNNSTEFIQELFKDYISKYKKNTISVKRYINCQWDKRNSVEEIIIKNY